MKVTIGSMTAAAVAYGDGATAVGSLTVYGDQPPSDDGESPTAQDNGGPDIVADSVQFDRGGPT